MKEMIESGKIKIEINREKQNRHSLGHKLYLKIKFMHCRMMRGFLAIQYSL